MQYHGEDRLKEKKMNRLTIGRIRVDLLFILTQCGYFQGHCYHDTEQKRDNIQAGESLF